MTCLPVRERHRKTTRISGVGEMADLTRSFDWSQSSLGAIEDWPDLLVVMVNVILATRHPMALMWGPDLIYFYNDAFRSSLGADKHPKALGEKGSECWREIWEVIGPQIEAVMSRGEASWCENQYLSIHHEGRLRDTYWTYSCSPVRDVDGSICAVLVTCSETTKIVLTERKLQNVLEATTDSVLSVDRNWCITYLNQRAAGSLAVAGDLIGVNIWSAFPSMIYEGSPYIEHYRRAMYEGIPADFEAYYPDPLNFWVHIIVRPCEDGLIFFFRDITQKKQEAAALLQTEKLAAVGRLASSIAHEINNPLESVTNLLYLLEHSADPQEQLEYLKQAQLELGRVARIATQTLRFHRQSTKAQPVHLQEVIEDVLVLIHGRIAASEIKIEKQYRTERAVSAYQADLRQVFANVIGNALDACKAGCRIILRTEDAIDWTTGERGVRLTVADNGHGMDEMTRRRMFEPFFTTKTTTGTGLGLWVSLGILQNHCARIRVRSSQYREYHGTVFSVFFPLESSLPDAG